MRRTINSWVLYTKFDVTVDEGKKRLDPSRDKNQASRRKKVDKSCVTFLLCDPGWCVHKSDSQNKWDDDTPTRRDQVLLFRTCHHLCRQWLALAGTRQLRSQGLVPVHAHHIEGVTRSEGREGSNGVGSGIGVGGGNGDGNRVGGGNGDGDGAGTGTGKGVEANEGAQGGNGDGSGDRAGTGTGTGTGTGVNTRGQTQDGNGNGSGDGNESSSGDGNGDEDRNGNGNQDRIGEGEGEAKERKKLHKSCRRHVGNEGDLGGKKKKRRKERVGLVAVHPDNLENNKEAGGPYGTQGLSKNCANRKSVSPSSRLIRGFRNKWSHDRKSGASQDLYGRMFRVGVDVGAGDAEVDITYIISMMRAQYKGSLGTVQDSDQKGAYTVLTYQS